MIVTAIVTVCGKKYTVIILSLVNHESLRVIVIPQAFSLRIPCAQPESPAHQNATPENCESVAIPAIPELSLYFPYLGMQRMIIMIIINFT